MWCSIPTDGLRFDYHDGRNSRDNPIIFWHTKFIGMLHKLVSRGEMRVVEMRRTQFLGPFVEVLQFQQGISKL